MYYLRGVEPLPRREWNQTTVGGLSGCRRSGPCSFV